MGKTAAIGQHQRSEMHKNAIAQIGLQPTDLGKG
jgi:hypothetical protein